MGVGLENFPVLQQARLSIAHGPTRNRLCGPRCGRNHALHANSQRARHAPFTYPLLLLLCMPLCENDRLVDQERHLTYVLFILGKQLKNCCMPPRILWYCEIQNPLPPPTHGAPKQTWKAINYPKLPFPLPKQTQNKHTSTCLSFSTP